MVNEVRVGRKLWLILILAVCISAIAFIFVTQGGLDLLAFVTADHSPFDYGPLRPNRVALPKSAPTSSVKTDNFIVECYSHPSNPVVITSRAPNNSIVGSWEIGPVIVNGQIIDRVTSLEIIRSEKNKTGYVIHGYVGGEHATFYFDNVGRLVEYWISW